MHHQHLRGGPQGHGCHRAQDDEQYRRDGGHRCQEGQGNADKRWLVLLTVVCAHLPVLEVGRPSLTQGLRHRREVSAVARCGAPWQGGGVV
eukprot:218810-Pleurochrysis_carterae.AAC.1